MSDAANDATPYAKLEADFAALFSTPLGRRVLQHICETAGVFEAVLEEPGDDILKRHGARALALDICTLAGALPEIPGSGGREEPVRSDEALTGDPPPEGDGSEEAEGDN